MARVTTVFAPSGLSEEYSSGVRIRRDRSGSAFTAGKPSTFDFPSSYVKPLTLAEAIDVALDTMHKRYEPSLSGVALRVWKTARETEIKTKTFPATYWTECALTENLTELFVPQLTDQPAPEGSPYYDVDHQPCRHIYPNSWSSYTTPAIDAVEPPYLPGWHGSIVSSHFHEDRAAQQVFRFTLHHSWRPHKEVPAFLYITADFQASASVQGKRVWFSFNVVASPSNSYPAPFRRRPRGKFRVGFKHLYQYQPDPPAAPWSQSLQRTLLIAPQNLTDPIDGFFKTRLEVIAAGFTSFGRYFGFNEEVTVKTFFTARLWQLKDL